MSIIPTRTMRAVVGGLLAVLATCLVPAAANAANFCVNDAACVANGGTAVATIEAAADLADNDVTSDALLIGASPTPYQLTSTIVIPSGRTLDVYGATAETTRIIAPAGAAAFSVADANTQLGRLGISGTFNTGAIVSFSAGTTSFSNVLSSTISNAGTTDGTAALQFTGSGTVSSSTLTAPMSSFGINALNAYSTSSQNVIVRDSTLTSGSPLGMSSIGTVTVLRSTLTYSNTGIRMYQRLAPKSVDLLVASTLIRHDNSLGGSTSAIGVESGDPGGGSIVNVDVVNSTIAHPSPAIIGNDYAFSTFTNNGAGVTNTNINLDVRGTIVQGPFTKTLVATDAADGGGTNYTTTAAFDRSNVDLAPGKLTLTNVAAPTVDPSVTNVDPKFVSAATGDYHLRYDSPLIDVGSGTLDPGEGTTDLDGRARLANKNADPLAPLLLDIGAYEYTKFTPVISASTASGTSAPGAPLTYAITVTDKNAGEAAALAYSWTLPEGGVAATPTVSFNAPTTAGTYTVAVTVTDLSGAAATATAQLVVPPPGAAPVAPAPVLADLVPPKVKLAATTAKLSNLLKRTPVSVKLTPNEAVSVKLTLVVKVATPSKRPGGRPIVTSVPLSATTAPLAAGVRTIKLTPTKAGAAKLAAALKVRGAKATYLVAGTALDATGNSATIATTLKVTA